MVKSVGPDDFDVVLKFGGGLHTRASEDDIGDREAAGGVNFQLDLERRELRPRMPFDLVGTVPNGLTIRGGGSFRMSDGSVKAFVQGGDKVYLWDGSDFQASPVLANVNASAKLRGRFDSHAWLPDDILLVTDLSLLEVVKKFTGTAMSNPTFLSGPSTSFGTFYAKYCQVTNERAFFGHCKDPGATTPHMIVGSALGDYLTISVSDRPSDSMGADDPFFLLAPDLKGVNGLVDAFGSLVVSTENGQIFNLTGASAKDFAFGNFFPGSAAIGAESLAYIGNDVIYGRRGRVESVKDTDRFGNAEAADITRNIADQIAEYTGWTTAYNSRLRRVYLFPTGVSEVWVFDVAMRDDGKVSAWMRWTTSHALAFQPTFVLPMLDPADGLEYVFMGDSSGHLYRLEGDGEEGDGGTSNIQTEFLSKMMSVPLDAEAFNIEGYIKYRKNAEVTAELVFEFAGKSIFNETISVDFPAAAGGSYYGGSAYYGGEYYHGSISGRLSRQPILVPGQSNEFQVRVRVNSAEAFAISEIGLRFSAAG